MTAQKKKYHKILFQPCGKNQDAENGSSLLAAVQKADIPLTATCGGHGKCGQCRLQIKKGTTPPLAESEKTLLPQTAIINGDRLACLISVTEDMEIYVPEDSMPAGTRLQISGTGQSVTIQPHVIGCPVEVTLPNRHDSRSDFQRIADSLRIINGPGKYCATAEVIKQLPGAIRNNQHLTVYLRENDIIGFASTESAPLGVAIDLGTTKIAATLLDLATGEELSTKGRLNPQISFGGDLISRLAYACNSTEDASLLATKVKDVLNELLGRLVEDAGVSRNQIVDLCIVGNTAMTHLLLEFPVSQLAGAPYVAATHTSVTIKASDLGLETAPDARVHVPGSIGGFVGGDHVSMVLASRLYQSNHITLGIDIGTNSEIALYLPEKGTLTCCSCASGPAFEGGQISCGMRAAEGAIETVTLNNGELSLFTIGDVAPKGICGSGIIDILAELCRNNIINNSGLLDKGSPLVRPGKSGLELVLAEADRAKRIKKDIVLTQKDISEIQLAKGAIRAGLEALLSSTETSSSEVKEVIVAGAFGSYLHLGNVHDIGMFPDFDNAHLHQIGNAALEGAKMMLLSKDERENGETIIAGGDHLETSIYKDFNRLFARGMRFPIQ